MDETSERPELASRPAPRYVDLGDIDLDEIEIQLNDGTRLTEVRAERYAQEIVDHGRPAT